MRKRLNCGLWPVLLVLALSVGQTWAYYNPASGRWLNRDPIGEEGGINLHAFAQNKPADSIDPLGMDPDFGGGRENFRPSDPRWINASQQDLENEIKRLRAKNDPKLKAHIRNLERWKKIRATSKYDKRYLHSRGRGGFASVGGMAAGAAATALVYAYEKLCTSSAVLDMRTAIEVGWVPGDKQSASAHLYDFVRHLDSGDTMWAELDALAYAVTQGGSIAAWDALTDEMEDAE